MDYNGCSKSIKDLTGLILDLCYKEGWTYHKQTQRKLIEYIIASAREQPLWTHKFLRESYHKFRLQHPRSLSWNESNHSYSQQLRKWLLSNLYSAQFGNRPSEADIEEGLRQMEAAGLSIVMLATGHQTDSFITPGERDELFRHLRELQPIWFPKTPLQEIQDDIISFYSRYRLSALPTYGFVFQMLQDMEDDHGFLTMCYRRTIIDESILTLSSNQSALRCTLFCMQELEHVTASASNKVRHDRAAMELLGAVGVSKQDFSLLEDADMNLFDETANRLQAIHQSLKDAAKDRELYREDRNRILAKPLPSVKSHPFLRMLHKISQMPGSVDDNLLFFSPEGDRILILETNMDKTLERHFDTTSENFSNNCKTFGYMPQSSEGLYRVFKNEAVKKKDDILFLQENEVKLEIRTENTMIPKPDNSQDKVVINSNEKVGNSGSLEIIEITSSSDEESVKPNVETNVDLDAEIDAEKLCEQDFGSDIGHEIEPDMEPIFERDSGLKNNEPVERETFRTADKRCNREIKRKRDDNSHIANTSEESSNHNTPPEKKARVISEPPIGREVGAWVYAYFKETSGWYFGVVSAVNIEPGRCKPTYDVIFFDGDKTEGLTQSKVYTAKYHREMNLKPKLTKDIEERLRYLSDMVLNEKSLSRTAPDPLPPKVKKLSLSDLLQYACNECKLCQRAPCGRCQSCRFNNRPTNHPQRVCYHKMCLRKSLEERKQTIPGFPKGWTFVVETPHEKACGVKIPECSVSDINIVPGLSIFAPGANRRLRSIHKAKKRYSMVNRPDIEQQLYEMLGVNGEIFFRPNVPKPPNKSEMTGDPISLRKAKKSATAKLASEKAPWGKRMGCIVYCRFRKNNMFYWGKITNLWWKDSVLHYQVDFLDGSGDVETDITEFPKRADGQNKGEKNLYSVDEMTEQGFEVPQMCIDNIEGDESNKPTLSGKRLFEAPYNFIQLEKKRCGDCQFCKAKECGECVSCNLLRKNGSGRMKKKQSCVRKMCSVIPLEKKAQSAPGFPRGWRFAFCEQGEQSKRLKTSFDVRHTFFDLDIVSVAFLTIISPQNSLFSSIDQALDHCQEDLVGRLEDRKNDFSRYIGANVLRYEPNHPLLNKTVRFEWLDINYKPRVLFGHVGAVARKEDGAYNSVIYTKVSRVSLRNNNVRENPLNGRIKEEEQFDESLAWGGALNFKRHFNAAPDLGNYDYMDNEIFDWIVPDMVTSEIITDVSRRKVPRLTIQVRGFSLTFTAKKSTIKNAGYGVFVTCTPIFDGSGDIFRLKDGELVDLGLYAPLRCEDRKLADLFLMKNFVLESKPEVYSFSSPHDTEQFDITDDVSGECHEWARERIPMYVNECDADKVHPTMHAHNDPEGHIHYLFGHKHTKKPLELPKDVEMEVFVNYGPDYEEVRVRLGYSFLNDEGEVNRLQEKMKLGPMDCLTSITQTFDIYSINENIDFFSRHLSRFLAINNNKILHHILAVCLLLRHRAKMVQAEKSMLAEVRRGSNKIISSILGCNGTREMQEYEKIGEEEQLIREVIKILFLHYPHVSKHSVDHFLDGLSFVREV